MEVAKIKVENNLIIFTVNIISNHLHHFIIRSFSISNSSAVTNTSQPPASNCDGSLSWPDYASNTLQLLMAKERETCDLKIEKLRKEFEYERKLEGQKKEIKHSKRTDRNFEIIIPTELNDYKQFNDYPDLSDE